MATLTWYGGPGPERVYRLAPSTTRIGRQPGLEVVLAHSSISRHHARIVRHGEGWLLQDEGSTNGTFRNRERIAKVRLEDGDQLVFGELKFRFSTRGEASTGAVGLFRGLNSVLDRLTGGEEAPTTAPPDNPLAGALEALRARSARWERAYRQLTVLYRISHALHGPEDLEQRLSKALRLAIGTLKAERGFLFRYRVEDDSFEAAHAFSRVEGGTDRIDWVRAVARKAVDAEGPMASGPDLAVGTEITRPPSGRVFVVAPLRTPRVSHGALYLDAPDGEVDWALEEVEFLEALAVLLGGAIDHEGYAEQLISGRETEKELAIARRIQGNLVGGELPSAPSLRAVGRSRPCREVGGDYLDTLVDSQGVLRWMVADVSGKGVPAALVQAQVRAHLRALSRRGVPADAALGDLNEVLLGDHGGRMYATAVVGEYDAEARVLRYVNAGHEFPLLLPAGAPPRALGEGDHPCGLFAGAEFETFEVPFGPGDRLVVLTDGVVDAQDPAGERFGPQRVEALVGRCTDLDGAAIVEEVFQQLDGWVRGAPQADDITLMVLEGRDQP